MTARDAARTAVGADPGGGTAGSAAAATGTPTAPSVTGAITGIDFWTRFLDLMEPGGRTSNPDYYLPNGGVGIDGKFATDADYRNVIKVLFERTEAGSPERAAAVDLLNEGGFWASTDDLDFWKTQTVNDADIADLSNAASDRFANMFGADGAPVGQQNRAEGGALSQAGVLSGGTLTKVSRADGTDLWGMTYVVQGIQHVYTFDSFEQMKAQLGDDAVTSGTYGFMTLDEGTLDDGDTWLMGPASTFAGQEGSYQTWFAGIQTEAALEAGARNPGAIGAFLQDPEVQRIIAEGAVGDWSSVRVQAELRTTDYFQNTLYPGITTFMNQGIESPESAYWNYMNSVDSSLDMLGYERGDDGTFKNQMAEMLNGGITASEFNTFAPTFVRAEQSQEFAGALNKWTQRDLGIDIGFEDWFSVLEGSASAELDAVVERAQLQFVADTTSTILDDETIVRLADLTQVSEEQMRVSFNQAEQALLSVGQRDLERFGLSQEALVSAAFGIDSAGTDPLNSDGSSFNAAEIQKRARKAATELGIQDDRKAQFFVGFDPSGRPVRQGLSASAPEFG